MTRLTLCLFFAAAASAQDGAAIYQKHCAECHDAGKSRAPRPDVLKQMSPERVETALTSGSMIVQGKALSAAEIRTVATFITGKTFGAVETAKPAFCAASDPLEHPLAGPRWNGWGADLTNRRAQPADLAGISADQVPKLKLKWAFGFAGGLRAYAQPAIAGGWLFVGSDSRNVYALDAASGCIHWRFEPDAPVRTAISIGPHGAGWAAYFGDQGSQAYAVDAATGKLLWKVRVGDHPASMMTGAPALYDGRLYVPVSSYEEVTGGMPKYECCKFRGSVTALDAATGNRIWKSYTIPEEPHPVRKNKQGTQLWGPSGAGVWSAPTVDMAKHAIYVATGDSYSDPVARTSDAFLAFDMDSGKMLWSRQLTEGDAFNIGCPSGDNCPEAKGPDFDFGSSPILVTLPNGKRALVAGQKSGMVHAVDPDNQGEVIWQTRIGKGGSSGGIMWGSATDDRNVYVALSDVGLDMQSHAEEDTNPTMFGIRLALDPKAGGGMFALDLATGKQVWHTPPPGCGERKKCSPAQSAAVTLIPGVVFSGDLDGHLRAYSTSDGRILWDVGTAQEYHTVNGVKAKGGAIDGPGPVVVNGVLYVNSGYGFLGGAPGNVLLAFSVDGK
jgi:polyvinyl alcohol dehydrogenase (cytochrome)